MSACQSSNSRKKYYLDPASGNVYDPSTGSLPVGRAYYPIWASSEDELKLNAQRVLYKNKCQAKVVAHVQAPC